MPAALRLYRSTRYVLLYSQLKCFHPGNKRKATKKSDRIAGSIHPDGKKKRKQKLGHDLISPFCFFCLFLVLYSSGADYGVCCMAADRITKPGTCPLVDDQMNSTVCGVPCANDMECQGADKCCPSVGSCGGSGHCVPPFNFSLCLQQQQIAQLLSLTEREGKGYIPQCDEDNQKFAVRQCSRNGLVCWCVDPDLGTKVKGSMGSAQDVVCDGLCT